MLDRVLRPIRILELFGADVVQVVVGPDDPQYVMHYDSSGTSLVPTPGIRRLENDVSLSTVHRTDAHMTPGLRNEHFGVVREMIEVVE
jgi:hypothetical protein